MSSRFEKTDTVERTLSELEKQSTSLISYFDSFFSTNFDKDTNIIREDGTVEVLSAKTVSSVDNPEGQTVYFQSSAERLQQISDLIKDEISAVAFDTSELGNEISALLSDAIKSELGYANGTNIENVVTLQDILEKNSDYINDIIYQPNINPDTLNISTDPNLTNVSLINFFGSTARSSIFDYIMNPSASGPSISIDVDVSNIAKYIDDKDNIVNATDLNGDGDFLDAGELKPPTTTYFINGKKLDTFSRDENGYLIYNDPDWVGTSPLGIDFNNPENLALAMFAMFSVGSSNNTKAIDSNSDGDYNDENEIQEGTKLETLEDAIEKLDDTFSDFVSNHRAWFDAGAGRPSEEDPDNGLYPPAQLLYYMNGVAGDARIDTASGNSGVFSASDASTLADLIATSPDTPNSLTISNILDNWETTPANNPDKLSILKYYAHTQVWGAVQSGLDGDDGITNPNPVINNFTTDNSRNNPFIGTDVTVDFEGNVQTETFPLLEDFLDWESDPAATITDSEGLIYTGTDSLGKGISTTPSQLHKLMDLYLQHTEKNIPRYVEDNRTILDLFASNSLLPGQDEFNLESAIYKDINSSSVDAISVTRNNLSRGISNVNQQSLVDILNQTLFNFQEDPSYAESDKINVINSFDPEKNSFVAGFPNLDIRDFDKFFKILLNDLTNVLDPLVSTNLDIPDDVEAGETLESIYGIAVSNAFLDIGTGTGNDVVKLIQRYEKITSILNKMEGPVNRLDNQHIIDATRTFGTATSVVDGSNPALIKEMLEGAYTGINLPNPAVDPEINRIDCLIDLFNEVEFGQVQSSQKVYSAQVLEAGNINARQFTKKLADPRPDGSLPEDTSVPAPLLYASSTSLILGLVGKEIATRVDEMNTLNNIPAYEINRNPDGSLDLSTGFSGASEGEQFLKNLLQIANDGQRNIAFNAGSINTDIASKLSDFRNSSVYKNVSLSYAQTNLISQYEDLWQNLKDAGRTTDPVYMELNKLFSKSSNDIIGQFIDNGYISTAVMNSPPASISGAVGVIKNIIENNQVATKTYNEIFNDVNYNSFTYIDSNGFKETELIEIRDFMQGYISEFDTLFNTPGNFANETEKLDIYKEMFKALYGKAFTPPAGFSLPDDDPLYQQYQSDLDLLVNDRDSIFNTFQDMGAAIDDTSGTVDIDFNAVLVGDNINLPTAQINLLKRFTSGNHPFYAQGLPYGINNGSMRFDNLIGSAGNGRVLNASIDLAGTDYSDTPPITSDLLPSITSNNQRDAVLSVFEFINDNKLDRSELANNYPEIKSFSMELNKTEVDSSSFFSGGSMEAIQLELEALKASMEDDPAANDTIENRKKYLRLQQHYQELFLMLSGATNTPDGIERYGIDISLSEKYGGKTLSEHLTDISVADDSPEALAIQKALEKSLNLDENINALQTQFDSQLTQRKQSASADRAVTEHFFKQGEIQGGGNFLNNLHNLFKTRMIKKEDGSIAPLDQLASAPAPFNTEDPLQGRYTIQGYEANQFHIMPGGSIDIQAQFGLTPPSFPSVTPVDPNYLEEMRNYLKSLSDIRDEMFNAANDDASKEFLKQYDMWLGNNSISRIMFGSLKDEAGVGADLNILDRMIEYQAKAELRDPSLIGNNFQIFDNFSKEIRDSLFETSLQEDNLHNLSMTIDTLIMEINTQPLNPTLLEHRFQEMMANTAFEPIIGGAYRIAGDMGANMRIAESAIAPQLKEAELNGDTKKIQYYNILLGHLLENKPLPDDFDDIVAEADDPATPLGAGVLIRPEDLVMSKADYEALPENLLPTDLIGRGAAQVPPITIDKFTSLIMREPYRSQLEIVNQLMTELQADFNSVPPVPKKEALYKSMIIGILDGGGINELELNPLVNVAIQESLDNGGLGAEDIFKPVDLFDALDVADADPDYSINPFGSLLITKSPVSYPTQAAVPELSNTYLDTDLRNRVVDERRRIDDNINPRKSELTEISELVDSYSPTFSLSDIAEDNSTENSKGALSGKTIQELLLLLFVFQMFERSSWDFNKYINDPNRYQS